MKYKSQKIEVITYGNIGEKAVSSEVEMKIYNDNNDSITSCHSYWAKDTIPHMVEATNEDLVRSNKEEVEILLDYKNKLEELLINFKEWDWERIDAFFEKKMEKDLEKRNILI